MGGGGGSAPTPPTVGQQLNSAVGAYQSLNSWQPAGSPNQVGQNLNGNVPAGNSLLNVEQNLDKSMSSSNSSNITTELGGLSNFYFNNELPQAESSFQTQQSSQNQFTAGQFSSQLPGMASSIYNSTPGVASLTTAAKQFEGTSLDSVLGGVAQGAAANGRSDTFNNTDAYVQGQVGKTSGTQAALNYSAGGQLMNPTNAATTENVNVAAQQLSLGSSLSQEQMDMAAQTSRAADSARGVFHSDGSAANEVLTTDQYGQQLLQQREAAATQAGAEANSEQNTANTFATNVGNLAQTETQNKTANAMNMASLDASITQANQGAATNAENSALSQQTAKQSIGVQSLQYLTGIGAQSSNEAVQTLTTPNQSTGYAAGGNSLSGVSPDVTPGFFNSLNLFGASQNASNQAFAAQQANYQSAQSAQTAQTGAAIGAGASIVAGGLIAL